MSRVTKRVTLEYQEWQLISHVLRYKSLNLNNFLGSCLKQLAKETIEDERFMSSYLTTLEQVKTSYLPSAISDIVTRVVSESKGSD